MKLIVQQPSVGEKSILYDGFSYRCTEYQSTSTETSKGQNDKNPRTVSQISLGTNSPEKLPEGNKLQMPASNKITMNKTHLKQGEQGAAKTFVLN